MVKITNTFRCIYLLFFLLTTNCRQQEEIGNTVLFEEAKFKVLAIGNSFTRSATLYIPDVLNNIYQNDVAICRVIKSGTSLEDHCTNLITNSEEYQYHWTTGGKWYNGGEMNIASALKYSKWDIVVIQQLSGLSGIPESYEPYISQLTAKIRKTCPNVLIGWQMTWSYSRSSTHPDFQRYNNDSVKMLNEIRATLNQVEPYVDIIIPSGEMINLLRQTKYNTATDLTVDGYHLMNGLPCIALSCLWHDTLITPFTGITCIETTLGGSDSSLLTKEEKEMVISLLYQLKK